MTPDWSGLRLLRLSEYMAASDNERLNLVPHAPALYAWKTDYQRLMGRSEEYVAGALKRFLQHKGTRRRLSSYFFDADVHDIQKEMRPDRMASVVREISGATELGLSLVQFIEAIQRPLYVGKAKSLYVRLQQHLDRGTPEGISRRGSAISSGLMHDDCMLIWVQCGPEQQLDVESSLQDLQFEEDASGSDDDDVEDPDVLPLTHYESLAIRLASPLHNMKIDS